MKKIILSAVVIASLFGGSVYATPAKLAPKPAPKPAMKVIAKPITYSQSQLDTLKLYSRIAQQYYLLGKIGDRLFLNHFSFTFAFIDLSNGYGSSTVDSSVRELNQIIEQYNTILGPTEQLIAEAGKKGINIANMRDILNKYSQSFDASYKASEQLYAFEIYKQKGMLEDANAAYQSFLDFNRTVADLSNEGITLTENYHDEFSNRIKGFK